MSAVGLLPPEARDTQLKGKTIKRDSLAATNVLAGIGVDYEPRGVLTGRCQFPEWAKEGGTRNQYQFLATSFDSFTEFINVILNGNRVAWEAAHRTDPELGSGNPCIEYQ